MAENIERNEGELSLSGSENGKEHGETHQTLTKKKPPHLFLNFWIVDIEE